MALVILKKGNQVYKVDEHSVLCAELKSNGFSVYDEEGKVISEPETAETLKVKIEKLVKENKTLKKQVAELAKPEEK